ncbi:hypothetical protein [Chamaesiphon polymorphus]|nr:hypothetical protein [Chamaesiphon polymorphus]
MCRCIVWHNLEAVDRWPDRIDRTIATNLTIVRANGIIDLTGTILVLKVP